MTPCNKGVLFLALSLIPVSAIILLVLQPDSAELAWKLKKGQVLKYRVSGTYSGTSIDGKVDTPVNIEVVNYLSVLDVNSEGLATIFRSDKGPMTMATLLEHNLISHRNPYSMNKRGQVIHNKSAYIRELRQSIESIQDDVFKQILEETENVNTDQFEALQGLEDFLLPEGRVRPGKEWSISAVLSNGIGQYRKTHRYRLRSLQGGMADIWMELEQKFIPGSETEFGVTMQAQQQQILTREATFSISNGVLMDFRQERTNIFTYSEKTYTTHAITRRTLIGE